ncbi:MAG TPA: lipopolysaccharide heptosyltransferase I [Candidatus Sulfotelmatobacter sp.]|nr:lipopolysaccharide heptosyltransferase I [Candidatus Sulfotelmatobacter sp.]
MTSTLQDEMPTAQLQKTRNAWEVGTRSSIARILIVRLSAMGDVIHTLPAVQLLRDAFPQAMIGWLIEERWAELLSAAGATRRGLRSLQRPLVDWVHTVNLKGWRNSLFSVPTLQQIATVWNDVRHVKYDLAVDLQGALRSAVLARWSGARVVWGASEPRESPASMWYTRQVIAKGQHVVEQNVSVAAEITQQSMAVPPAILPRDPTAEAKIAQKISEHRIREFVIVNPGAGWGAKRWPVERYGQVARDLAETGLRSVINYGPGEEALALGLQRVSQDAAAPMRLSLTELIALTRCAKLFIGGDTGPLHLAAALRVPVVAIFGPTDPARNGPYGTRSVVLRSPASLTTHTRHSQPEQGLLEITAESVTAAACSLLAETHE